MRSFFLFACFWTATYAIFWGQNGSISGKVVEAETGENVLFATVQLLGNSQVTSTDLDGNYHFANVPEGTYSIEVSGISYAKTTLTGVVVEANKVTEKNVRLAQSTIEIEAYTIEAQTVQNSEVALLSMQQKATGFQDGISSEELSRSGAGDAGESIKYVTGASVEENKYVVIRGLGDRYSITQINGITTPSTDPYRNSTSLDLVPNEVLDNMVVQKTFTPDQPGNFTGGNVNISTKSLPEAFFLSLGFGLSFNTQSSFQDDFIFEENPGMNFLGYANGDRDLPRIYQDPQVLNTMTNLAYLGIQPISGDPDDRRVFNETARGLANTFVPSTKNTPFNSSFNLTFGNRHDFKNKAKSRLGYVLGLNQSTTYSFYQDGVFAGYVLPGGGVDSLQEFFSFNDIKSTETVRTGALIGTTFWLNQANEFSFTGLYNHNGELSSQLSSGFAPQILSQSANAFTTITNAFREQFMANGQLKGRHYLQKWRTQIEWMGGYTRSQQDEPDMKLFAYQTNQQNTSFLSPSEFDNPFHYFRNLSDNTYEGKIDIEVQYTKHAANTIKFGGFFNRRERDFIEQRFQLDAEGTGAYINPNNPLYSPAVIPLQYDTTPDFSMFFNPNNFGIVDTSANRYIHANYLVNQTRATNVYNGFEQTAAAYAMITFDRPKWKIMGGARLEHIQMSVFSSDTGSIDAINVLPALTAIYKIKDNMNLRAAYSMTLARPNLRELAPFVAYDLIGAPSFNGNPDLQLTNITNLDLRYEYFFSPGEVIALSLYAKEFNNPIIRSYNPLSGSTTGEIVFTNVAKAQVAGLEIDFRKSLKFISPVLENLKFTSNFSLIYSRVDIDSLELNAIQNVNPDFGDYRPFQGQSPYLINLGLSWELPKPRLETALTLNYFADRLSENSQAGTPDIYEAGRAMLNFTASKVFGKKNTIVLKAGVNNILNANFKRYIAYRDFDYTVSDFQIGQTFNLSVTYKIK